jgi:hypothetical protein
MKKIARARLKPMKGAAAEYLSTQGRIKSLIQNNSDDNFDFVIDDDGKKSVKSFGVDNINPELVGETLDIINSEVKAKFNEDGSIEIVEGSNENRIMRFGDFEKVYEALPRQHSIDQLKKLRKLTKGIDIGDRVPNMKQQGANIHFMRNPVDSGIESYEDFEKHNKGFIPGWNSDHKMGPFDGRKSS